jgi:hypothetical protein
MTGSRLACITQGAGIIVGARGSVRQATATVRGHGRESQIVDVIDPRGRDLNIQDHGDAQVGVSRLQQAGHPTVGQREVDGIPDVQRLTGQLDLIQKLAVDVA